MSEITENVLGPRVPDEEFKAHRGRYLAPIILFLSAALLLLISMFLPYWQLTLNAPQYPQGLTIKSYLTRQEGDVAEIDGLNHYIGMRPLAEAATFERSISMIGVIVLILLILAAVFIHSKWAVLLALPALLFPVIFIADLQYWLADFGQNLDPKAPLSSSIKPFVPPALGEGIIAQFSTWAVPDVGLWLAILASLLTLAGLFMARRAYKPLLQTQAQAA
ncbi:MAG: cytochrome C [Chloroflexi bacterium]|nr:cytochrome C [Chloroflexota bacterium]